LERLDEIHERLLTVKKQLSDSADFDAATVNAKVKCIGDILQLRVQARETWKHHCASAGRRR
jgi:hypothetical protein